MRTYWAQYRLSVKKNTKPSWKYLRRSPYGIVANELDCNIVVSEFVLQSRYYIHFQTNTLGKGMNHSHPHSAMDYVVPLLFFSKDDFCIK